MRLVTFAKKEEKAGEEAIGAFLGKRCKSLLQLQTAGR